MPKQDRYINAEDFLEWLADEFSPGENGAVDFVMGTIENRINTMPYLTRDGRMHDPFEEQFEEEPEDDPFERADFEHDDMIEEAWND